MTVKIVGQQLRIRIMNPNLFSRSSFRVHDRLGKTGKLQKIIAIQKTTKKWKTQAWRLNLNDYSKYSEAMDDIIRIENYLTAKQFYEAEKLILKWWMNKKYGR